MSLGRLLTAGKSLTTLRETPTAYRVNERASLPKFGAAENPSPAARRQSQTAAKTAAKGVSAAHAKGLQNSADQAVKAPMESATEPGSKSVPVASRLASIWPWKWLKRLEPADSPAPGKPGKAAWASLGNRKPVQGELSLDNVKVVRNDLSETDFFVASAGPSESTGRRFRGARLLAGAVMAEKALDRLAERIVGAGPT